MVFALVGLGASLEAVYVHYRLLSAVAQSFCDVNVTVSCSRCIAPQHPRHTGGDLRRFCLCGAVADAGRQD
jgi:hypothetical protein